MTAGLSPLRQAHSDLLKCYRKIQEEFVNLDEQTLAELLGKCDSPRLRQQVKKFGDGQVLCSLPRTTSELEAIDALVLFAGTSPKLDNRSDFNRFTPLHEIPYWRDGRRLLPHVSKGTQQYRLHFMTWQQKFAVHGIDDSHACANHTLLLRRRPNLKWLFRQSDYAAIEFVNRCQDWITTSGRSMILITQVGRYQFSEPILRLKDDPSVIHIKAQLRGKNYRIMSQISEGLILPSRP